MTTEEMLLQLIEGQKRTDERLDKMTTDFNKRFDKIEDDIAELRHETEITRSATNKLVENFEDLVKVLNETNTVYFKVH